MTIKEFVQGLQKSRGITQAELSKCMGYKSQTSLVRIVHEKANQDSLKKFAKLLRSAPGITLSAAENAALDLILEKRLLGEDEYAAMDSLRRMLQESDISEEEVTLRLQDGTVQLLSQRYRGMKNVRVLLLNCERVQMFSTLARMMSQDGVKVEHYVYAGGSPAHTAEVLRVVMPVLHHVNYSGYLCQDEGRNAQMPRGLSAADMMMCEYQTAQGCWKHDVIFFADLCEGVLAEFEGSMAPMQSLVLLARAEAKPLRGSVQQHDRQDDYLAYARYCSELEKDRAVYRFKPDFGIEQVPMHIWRRAFEEGPMGEHEAIRPMLDALAQDFDKRHQNAMQKKQPTCHVLKERAVWAFVNTGRLSDQFWAFRALTWEERLEVLQLLLRQQINNPWFNLLLLKDDDAVRDDEVVYYEGAGLFIVKPGTDYSLSGCHAETVVTNPDILKVFKHFYQESVLQFHVKPESETRKLLIAAIEHCQRELARQ